MTSPLQGLSLIAGRSAPPGGRQFHAVNPATGAELSPAYSGASSDDIALACGEAARAFPLYRATTPAQRAEFLERIAGEIEGLGDVLIRRFVSESGLPAARAEGERARTCGQLRLFAGLAAAGAWVDARIDTAQPGRRPAPRPDVRSALAPIGPVAVFGPANFPLAFSVAGGDTASALAAGCPVVVKAHSSHPGTSELVGAAVKRAAAACGMPGGTFSLLFGDGRSVGTTLVQHPAIRGVGFTGSRSAGAALFALCNSRPRPIPFFGELSSLNPVFLLPRALADRPEVIAEGLHASVTLGHGQFCTNPGLVLYIPGTGADAFVHRLAELMGGTPPGVMLNAGSLQSYRAGVERLAATPGIESLLPPSPAANQGGRAAAALFRTDAANLAARPTLTEEVFGPCTLLVRCRDLAEMQHIASQLEGQLTATIHASEEDLPDAAEPAGLAADFAGRIVFNGYPTGVEVCHAMVHSGPWPAATDSRFTSVGSQAVRRWLRPVCWQNAPAVLLPAELQDANPLGILRLVNGSPDAGPVGAP